MKKIRIVILTTISFCALCLLITSKNANNSTYLDKQHIQTFGNIKNLNSAADASIFRVNFVNPNSSKSTHNIDEMFAYHHLQESQSISKPMNTNLLTKQLQGFNISFDDEVTSNSSVPESINSEGSSHSGLVINDSCYMQRNSNQDLDIDSEGHVETIFVSDFSADQLIGCRERDGSYTCTPSVSKLNNPQDILVVDKFIYIINSHRNIGESGDLIKCNITDSGYISGCGMTRINLINPIFFYSAPPYIYISEFVYSDGQDKQFSALKCEIEYATGNLTHCSHDSSLSAMSYISKFNNGVYYRPHANNGIGYIEKCNNLASKDCLKMANNSVTLPLSISINYENMFIADATSRIIRCSLDLQKCKTITESIKSPMCIGVYNFTNKTN